MTAKEIKDYLRTEEKILWEELQEEEKVIEELEEKGLAKKKERREPAYVMKLAKWGILWDICKDLGIEEE